MFAHEKLPNKNKYTYACTLWKKSNQFFFLVTRNLNVSAGGNDEENQTRESFQLCSRFRKSFSYQRH